MTTLCAADLDPRALRALEIERIRNENIDRILAESRARNAYRPWTEIDNASDVDQFIPGPQS